MFDPEKVARFDGPACEVEDMDGPFTTEEGGYFVRASDYDQLLALYKDAIEALRGRRRKGLAAVLTPPRDPACTCGSDYGVRWDPRGTCPVHSKRNSKVPIR